MRAALLEYLRRQRETLITIIKNPRLYICGGPFRFRQRERETERRSRTARCLPARELLLLLLPLWSLSVQAQRRGPSAAQAHAPTQGKHTRARLESGELDGRVGLRRHLRVRLCAVDGRFHQRRSSHGSVKAASNTLALLALYTHTPRARARRGAVRGPSQHTR